MDNMILEAGAIFFALSLVGHTEPMLVNVLTCVQLPLTACGAGYRSLRFEHLRRGAAYPLEALSELRAMRLAAQVMEARVAREIARASLLAQRLERADRQMPVYASVRDPVGLCA